MTSDRGFDVNVGDVTDVCVSWEKVESGDVEILQNELDVVILVLSPRNGIVSS